MGGHRRWLGVGASMLLLAGSVGSVARADAADAAVGPTAPRPGGAWSVLDGAGRRGMVVVRWADTARTEARLWVHVTGLKPGGQVRLVLSKAGCDTGLSTADRLFSARLTAGVRGIARGGIWRAGTPIVLAAGVAGDIRSAWLVTGGGAVTVCGAAGVWDDTDIVHVLDGAVAVVSGKGYRGLIVLGPADGTGSDLAYSLSVGPDVRDLRLVGAKSSCARPVTASDRLFRLRLRQVRPGVAFAHARTETVDKDETITIHALRIRPASGPGACSVPSIIAVLIGL